MSETALYFKMLDSLGSTRRLSAFYDFQYSSAETDVVGAGMYLTGVLENSNYTNSPSLHTGYVLGSVSSSESTTTGLLATILDGDKIDLTAGNLRIPLDGLNSNNFSAIIDFEFDGVVDDGVILGCFTKDTETIDSNDFETSDGFNIGVTDRGHLFCQTFNSQGDSISVIPSIELSKRNVIGVSITNSTLSLCAFDYFNSLTRSVDIVVDQNYTYGTGYLTFGGSDTYFRSNSYADTTFSGSLHHLALLSGYIDPRFLKDLGEGMLGEYYATASSEISDTRVTGYSETVVYKTGITGYDYEVTGTLTIATGREYVTGSAFSDSSESKTEGERYYKYYTLNNGGVETFYKEELGKLHSNSGYVYYPTGEDAYDTLGLNDISESIQTYTETSGIEQDSISINLYGKTALTGTLSEISGVNRTALEETFVKVIEGTSGVNLEEDSEGFKKNFIYYMGDRS